MLASALSILITLEVKEFIIVFYRFVIFLAIVHVLH